MNVKFKTIKNFLIITILKNAVSRKTLFVNLIDFFNHNCNHWYNNVNKNIYVNFSKIKKICFFIRSNLIKSYLND